MIDVGNGHSIELIYGDERYFGQGPAEQWEALDGDTHEANRATQAQHPVINEDLTQVPYFYVQVEEGVRPDPSEPQDASKATPFREEARMVLVGMMVNHSRQTPTFWIPEQTWHPFVDDPSVKRELLAEVTSLNPLTIAGPIRCGAIDEKTGDPCSDVGWLVDGRWLSTDPALAEEVKEPVKPKKKK